MFDVEKAIAEWREQMRHAGMNRPEVLDELEAHLRSQVEHLIASGVSEEESFQKAKEVLGNGTVLKQEFSKVRHVGLSSSRSAPILLNLLAFWFALKGVAILYDFRWVFEYFVSKILTPNLRVSIDFLQFPYLAALDLLSLSFIVLIVIGLFRRQNFGRYFVFAWSALTLFASIAFYVTHPTAFHLPNPILHGQKVMFVIMGLSVPYQLFCIWLYLPYAVSIGSVYYLLRPEVRALFSPATRFEHA